MDTDSADVSFENGERGEEHNLVKIMTQLSYAMEKMENGEYMPAYSHIKEANVVVNKMLLDETPDDLEWHLSELQEKAEKFHQKADNIPDE